MRKRIVKACGSREERKTLRAAVGSLRKQQLSDKMRERYVEGIRIFNTCSVLLHGRLARGEEELDAFMSGAIEVLWAEGEPKHIAADTIWGLAHLLPSTLKCQLQGSRRLYKAWSKKEIPARAHPLLPRQVIALAGYFTFICQRPRWAAIILLGFHCVLRTIEMLNCKRKDIVIAASGDAGVVSFDSNWRAHWLY